MSDTTTLTLHANHSKSMNGERDKTRWKRERQTAKVMQIVTARFRRAPRKASSFAVLGHLNDYLVPPTSSRTWLHWDQLENVVERLPEADQWTHYWTAEDEYRQLDHLLAATGHLPGTAAAEGRPLQGQPVSGNRTGPARGVRSLPGLRGPRTFPEPRRTSPQTDMSS
ncbi:hypothetical protein [Streptomyces fulvoviolaceus]|uniref:hypothetical protein n=1 Tax=Streptomyces fulvoviolaceus TaxID=285535 RepID=UPI0021BE8927|nr:hypothetical protein [Streptomyces fulvoviolaceus]MCT9081832.1 hypothetical protein [Streptomyces fulvoviolaceus]